MKGKPHDDPNCRCEPCRDWHTLQMMQASVDSIFRYLAELIRQDPQCANEFERKYGSPK
jgi:hypothetical protein